MEEFNIFSIDDTKLDRVVAAEDTDNSDDIAVLETFDHRYLINIQGASVLGDRGIAIGVDGANGSIDNLHAGGLQHVVASGVFKNLSNGHFSQRQFVVIGEDPKLIVVTTVDAGEFNEAVIDGFLSVGQNHVADSQSIGNGVVIEIQVDTSGFVLDINVTSVDEGHHTLHKTIIIELKSFCIGNGHLFDNGVGNRCNGTVAQTFFHRHGFHRGSGTHHERLCIFGAVYGRSGAVEGIIDGGTHCVAGDTHSLGSDVGTSSRCEGRGGDGIRHNLVEGGVHSDIGGGHDEPTDSKNVNGSGTDIAIGQFSEFVVVVRAGSHVDGVTFKGQCIGNEDFAVHDAICDADSVFGRSRWCWRFRNVTCFVEVNIQLAAGIAGEWRTAIVESHPVAGIIALCLDGGHTVRGNVNGPLTVGIVFSLDLQLVGR